MYRLISVAEPFGRGEAWRFALRAIAEEQAQGCVVTRSRPSIRACGRDHEGRGRAERRHARRGRGSHAGAGTAGALTFGGPRTPRR